MSENEFGPVMAISDPIVDEIWEVIRKHNAHPLTSIYSLTSIVIQIAYNIQMNREGLIGLVDKLSQKIFEISTETHGKTSIDGPG